MAITKSRIPGQYPLFHWMELTSSIVTVTSYELSTANIPAGVNVWVQAKRCQGGGREGGGDMGVLFEVWPNLIGQNEGGFYSLCEP